MNILSWNCRWIGNLRAIQLLKDPISSKKPDVLFLIEMLVGVAKMKSIKTQLVFEGMVVIEKEGHNVGLALLRKTKNTVSLLGFSQNFIDVVVKIPDLPIWRMIGFYGCPERRRKRESWDILINLSN